MKIGILFIISYFFIAAAAAQDKWIQTIPRGSKKPMTKIHFYVHIIRSGPGATLFKVANSSITDTSPTGFGQIDVFDNKITVSPDINSLEVARGQGLATSSDLNVMAFNMCHNFYLTAGECKGSTISIAGRNQLGPQPQELPVVGGTGSFRYARGYAITSSYSFDETTNYSILDYTVYITSPSISSHQAF